MFIIDKAMQSRFRLIALLCSLMLLLQCFIFAEKVFGATVGQTEINQGLEFCREYPVSLMGNGEKITFDAKEVPPVIITPQGETNGRTLIPARALFEKLGAIVEWCEEEQKVTVSFSETKVEFVIDKDIANVNGTKYQLDVPALIIDHDGDYFGSTMIPVRFVSESLGFKVDWDDDTRTINVSTENIKKPEAENSNSNTGTNTNTETKVLANGLPVLCEEAKIKLIVIDSGHGGVDSGSIGHKGKSDQLYEKDINLPVALKLKEYLESAGANIYMLKETDKYIGPYDRTIMANEAGGDFFVSIHNNSENGSKQRGTLVIYSSKTLYGMYDDGKALTKADKAIEWATSIPAIQFDAAGNPIGTSEMENYGITSGEVASAVLKNMVKELGTESKGTKDDNAYIVLNCTRMPAIIVEGAFLSNEQDLAMMRKPEFVDRYAYATAKGIIEAFNNRFGK